MTKIFKTQNAESSKLLVNEACGWFASLCHQSDRRPRRTKQKHEVDSSVASLLQNDVQGAWEFFGLCAQNDKAAQGDSSDFAFGMTRQSEKILRALRSE